MIAKFVPDTLPGMLSPGKHHLMVPRNLVGNLQFRLSLIEQCQNNPEKQAAMRLACSEDLRFYAGAWVWQFNPRKKDSGFGAGPKVAPFIPWDFQEDALMKMLWHIERGEDLVIEKSREMGASWMILIVFKWLTDFHKRHKFLMMSRSEEAVESEDPDSLFWKVDFMYQHEPRWLCGYTEEDKTSNIRRRKRFFGNNKTKSTLTGTASTGKAGVGGRASAMGIDEYSQIKEDYEVLHRTSDTTDCRIFNFTHTGTGTAAYEISQRVDMKKMVLHWTMHPEKNKGLYKYNLAEEKVEFFEYKLGKIVPAPRNLVHLPANYEFIIDGKPTGGPFPGYRSPWYDKQCLRKGSARAIAMDLDINAAASASQVFNELTIRSLRDAFCCEPYARYKLFHDTIAGKPIKLVRDEEGPLHLWCQIDGMGRPPWGRYGAGCDLAVGTGCTNTCLSIINADTCEKVLEFADPNMEGHEFTPLCAAILRLFYDALIAWEKQGPGLIFGSRLMQKYGYINVWRERKELPFIEGFQVSDNPGWSAEPKSQRVVIEEYRTALEQRHLTNRSDLALAETLNFKYDAAGQPKHSGINSPEDPSGARENHGDRVIADALAWKMCQHLGIGQPELSPEESVSPLSLAYRRELHHNALRMKARY